MDRHTLPHSDGSEACAIGPSKLWWLVFLGLWAWQVWMTLSLFAPPATSETANLRAVCQAAWERLLDDEPVVSGRHPLHLYFGYLGAQTFRERGTLCRYDPSFQAGFLKTPVFDVGSRPAELFLLLGGADYRPAAYKIGLAVCCALVPLFLALAARGLGLRGGWSCLAVALGLLVQWSTPGQTAFEQGDLDLFLAGIASLAFVGLLLAFHRAPQVCNWFGLLLTGVLGWFAHPLLWLLLFPLLLIYYFSIGVRHQLGWHLALFLALAAPVGVNSVWLVDWLRYWWIRLPLQLGSVSLKHRTFHTVWSSPLWGDAADRILGITLFSLMLLGIGVLNQTRERLAARLLGLAGCGFFLLTLLGLAWEPVGRVGAMQLLTPALWFAVLPTVYVVAALHRLAVRRLGSPGRVAVLVTVLAAVGVAWGPRTLAAWLHRWTRTTPLTLGLGPQRQEVVETLRAQTSDDARILWEDQPAYVAHGRWCALLPLLTDRAYIGGLAPDGCIEHAFSGLLDQALLGRHISLWTDAELDEYCRRYNVGWVAAWSPAVQARLRAWKGESAAIPLQDSVPGQLFPVGTRAGFVLKGKARVLSLTRERIALADVVPDENGVVVLSLHYQAGLRASPARIQVEREPDPFDLVPFLRLRVPQPTALITLTWDEP
jgi:hypothetical protein